MKPFKFEEKLKIRELLSQNLSGHEIARRLSRYPSSINSEIKNNGGHDNYDPISSHKKIEKLAIRRRNRLTISNKKDSEKPSNQYINELFDISNHKENLNTQHSSNETTLSIEERLTAIQDQISLIFDIIKEMKNDS